MAQKKINIRCAQHTPLSLPTTRDYTLHATHLQCWMKLLSRMNVAPLSRRALAMMPALISHTPSENEKLCPSSGEALFTHVSSVSAPPWPPSSCQQSRRRPPFRLGPARAACRLRPCRRLSRSPPPFRPPSASRPSGVKWVEEAGAHPGIAVSLAITRPFLRARACNPYHETACAPAIWEMQY